MHTASSSYQAMPSYAGRPVAQTAGALSAGFISANAGAYETLKARIANGLPQEATRRHYVLLGAFAVLLHGAALLGYVNRDAAGTPAPPRHEVVIELLKPVVVPPQEATPPPLKTPPPAPVLRTRPAAPDIAPAALTVPENTEAPRSAEPVEAPAPKVEETVTEATGNAAYLNNPSPEYPAFAQRQGWEGKVLLRVHVLASGKPDKVEIIRSSGRKTLDESALAAVRNWTFVPSRRGSTPVDGWATVPIEFKLAR